MSPGRKLAPTARPNCPRCRQNDQVEKVSAIYMESLAGSRRLKKADLQEETSSRLTRIEPAEVRRLGKLLAPPATPNRIQTRPIHPDMVVVFFSIVLPFFLVGIFNNQRDFFLPGLAVLVTAYILYFFTRKSILQKFNRNIAERKVEATRVEKAIQRWMGLFYCVRDQTVFIPGSLRTTPPEELNSLLYE